MARRRGQHDNYTPPDSVGAGPSRTPATGPDQAPRLRRNTRPIPLREQALPGLGPNPFGSREIPSALDYMRGAHQEGFLAGEYSSGGSGVPSLVPFVPANVRMQSFPRSAQRPAGVSLANQDGTDLLDKFLADVRTVRRDIAPFDSFLLRARVDSVLLQARARDAMGVDETHGGLIVAPPWHVDSRRGGTFFVGLRGSVPGRNDVPLFRIEAEDGGTLGVDADVLARLLLSDRAFEEAMDEGAASVTMLGWDNGIPATLTAGLAKEMRDRLGREVSVYAATGTVVVGVRRDGVDDDGYIGVGGGGHWQVSGYRDPDHDSGIASELASALAQRWRYARPRQAESPIDDSDRYRTLGLTRSVRDSIEEGLAEEPGVLSLQHAADLAGQHANPYLPVLGALKFVTRNPEVAASVGLVRDAWLVRDGGTQKWDLFPVIPEIWSRLGGTPGRATAEGRKVIREPKGTAPAMAGRLTIRRGQNLTPQLRLELAALARQLAEAARPGLGGVVEHADIVVHGRVTDGLADEIRERLVSAAKSCLARLGIDVPGITEQLILPFRRAADADGDADPRVEIVIRSHSELVLEEYPWLPDVNPRRDRGGNFMANCLSPSRWTRRWRRT